MVVVDIDGGGSWWRWDLVVAIDGGGCCCELDLSCVIDDLLFSPFLGDITIAVLSFETFS